MQKFFFIYRTTFLLSLCLLSVSAHGQSKSKSPRNELPKLPDTYLRVQASGQETGLMLLKRYDLDGFPCNVQTFEKLNGMKANTRLKSGGAYQLPLYLVRYNGKSIRTTLQLEDWQTARRIEVYNKNAQKKGLRNDNFILTKDLWVPFHELNCPDYGEPVAKDDAKAPARQPVAEGSLAEPGSGKGGRIFPIFGPAYAKTPLVSRRLRNRVFYIVSGHGGPDVGAMGKRAGHTLCEDEYAYDVSLRLLRHLVSHGAMAYMIVRDPNDGIRDQNYLKCDKDELVWGERKIPLGQRERLQQRVDLINELTQKNLRAGLSDQTLIEIHVDSRSNDDRIDVFFYYRSGSEQSKAAAQQFQKTFAAKYAKAQGRRFNGTVSTRNLFMLTETTTPSAIYIELANIKNSWDQQRLVITSNRQALANWMLEAIFNL